MRAIVILSVILVGAFCAATAEKQLVRDLFSQWKLAHGKTYKAGHEEEHRFNVFLRNYITIQTHNQKNSGVTLALNQFADLTKEEFTSLYTGELPTTQHETNNAKASSFENVKLPESVDWRTKGAVAPIRNQLACGSCWAFSAVANLESFYYINHGELPILSPQNLVDCDTASFGCNGGWKFTAFTYSAKNGLERESDYPYTARNGKCAFESSKAIKLNTGYTNVTTKSAVALKTAVVDQPVTVSIQANEAVFQFYRSGVITSGCGKSTNHAVLVVGYDTFNNVEAFIVKNSWGTVWGNQGYVLISTDESQNQGLGVCGILYTPAFPTGK